MIETAARLLDAARALGAQEAQVRVIRTEERDLRFERNAIRLSSSSNEMTFDLRVHADSRLGTAKTNSAAPDDLEDCAASAVALARVAEPDAGLNLPGPIEAAPPTRLHDPSLAALSPAGLSEIAREYLAAATSDPRIVVDMGSVTWICLDQCLLNTHGVVRQDRSTMLRGFLAAMGRDGEALTGMEWVSGGAHTLDGALPQMMDEARELGAQLVQQFHPRVGHSYRGAVLFAPSPLLQLLHSTLQMHLSGQQVLYGKSAWGDDRIGSEVASPLISLVDDPTDVALLGACNFDGEGVPTARRDLIREGRLVAHMENAWSARRRGKPLTGHSDLAMHAPCLLPGRDELAAMQRGRDPLLYVRRFSGNTDPVRGDFSGVAKCSFLLHGGERTPVKETMIAGNVFELLRNVLAVADEDKVIYGSTRFPHLLADGVSVTGAEG